MPLAIVMLLTSACGGNTSTVTDAGGDAPADVGADSGNFACDPAAPSCGTGQKCDFTCQNGAAAVACIPDTGTGAIGATCSTTTMQCAGGSGCVAMPSGGGPLCRKYCTADTDCATGERCHNVTVGVTCTSGTTSLPLHFCY